MPRDVPTQTATIEREPTVKTRLPSSVCALISSQAEANPGRTAVVDGTTRLSYAELDGRSDRLAGYLRDLGAGPECCVGLLFERSADFVVTSLAVLKAGAAYLPLDPSMPPDRASFILADAEASLLLTHRGKARNLESAAWRVLELDGADAARIEARPARSLGEAPEPDSLAYVIYTSGSTGQPKGVEITHANLANLVAWHREAFRVTPADRVSQIAGLGFDAAVWEVWPSLAAGASLHIADEKVRRSPQALRDWLIAEGITIGFVPTLLAEQLLQTSWPKSTALRTMLTGADTLHRRPAPGLPFVLVNNYGPTECTVVATSGIVAPDVSTEGPPSIGRPIANALALILDDSLRAVPPGEAGELCLAGALVGRGYRNNPALTASRFVTYFPASGPSIRVYRTGDRVRLRDDGEMAFLGRLDDQVKVRGYRIELGEIVTCLDRYPGIAASAAVLRGSAGPASETEGDPTLVAYVVAPSARLSASDLRDFLASRLPDYMIPAQFVAVEALPVTANGKLDKSSLPAPCAGNSLPDQTLDAVLPAEPAPAAEAGLETRIASVVALLLGQPSVDREDNFFLGGGHSMFGVQLVARLRDTFGVKLTLRQLFNAPTVASLSAEVARLVEATGTDAA